jgi:2-amino-4-hydroxy-6-hydroxymethyldihydropteridine diphosphokinase
MTPATTLSLDEDRLVLGVGGNLGDEAAVLARFAGAVSALAPWGPVYASPVYRTAPVGPAQPDYLNAALALTVPEDVAASALLREVQTVEYALGRRRVGGEERWGPRAIDLDVLLWGSRVLRRAGAPLLVPHPQLARRRFALQPTIDLLGGATVLPGNGPLTLGEALAALGDDQAQRIERTDYVIAGAEPMPG